jgi:hypothetical protein
MDGWERGDGVRRETYQRKLEEMRRQWKTEMKRKNKLEEMRK